MQITNQLYQFSDRKSLLLATGKQQARIYYCFDGTVEEIDFFKEPKPRYSDREGQFMRSGRGMVMGTGSVYEAQDDVATRYFLHHLAERVKEAVHELADHEVSGHRRRRCCGIRISQTK